MNQYNFQIYWLSSYAQVERIFLTTSERAQEPVSMRKAFNQSKSLKIEKTAGFRA